MKFFLTLIILSNFSATAQSDSSHFKKIPFTYITGKSDLLCVHRTGVEVIQNDSVWKQCQLLCHDSIMNVDFNKYTVWQRSSGGDCHARFTHFLFIDTFAKKMIWVEHNWYGGCRAAKFEEFRILFPKPPKGYTFELKEIMEKRYSE